MDEKNDELSNEMCMGAIDYTTQRDIKPHRNGVYGHMAERLIQKGYRKESDTAREIFDKMLGYIGSQQQFCIVDEEQKTLIDCDKLFDFVGKLAKEKYDVDLGE